VVEVEGLAQRADLLGPDDRDGLRRRLPHLAAACRELDSIGVPSTLVHGDVSPGNVRWTGKDWLVYDWTDACITNPFQELASPLSYESDERVAASRARAFAGVWASFMPSCDIERALVLSRSVGAAHQAVSYRQIVDTIDRTAGDQAGGDRLVEFARYWVRRLLVLLGR
jgi:Ser/Thr protein kinase RdoA (MazF antagonist)